MGLANCKFLKSRLFQGESKCILIMRELSFGTEQYTPTCCVFRYIRLITVYIKTLNLDNYKRVFKKLQKFENNSEEKFLFRYKEQIVTKDF
jgi:hypothetical protein